jgi:hypothetical protein
MKYIITETLYNNIVEGNKRIDAFQELINQKVNEIKEEQVISPQSYCLFYRKKA